MEPERQVESKLTRSDFLPLWGFALGLLPTLLVIVVIKTSNPCQPTLLTTILNYTIVTIFFTEVLFACVVLFHKPLRDFGLSLLITLLITCALFLLCIFSSMIWLFAGPCLRITQV